MNRIFIYVLFSFLLTSCAKLKFQSKTEFSKPIYLNHQSGDEIRIQKQFVVDYYFWGNLPLKRVVYVEDLFDGEGIESASNFEVTIKRSFKSYLFIFATLGIYYPMEGEVSVHIKKPDSNQYKFEHKVLEGKEMHP
ncbi:MAG: hypothetical protein L6Q33_14265 [Bacteriovoracaceae bacterium]|nr:hypothetical protein [Bacteriovoracaceae bacterium]